MFSWEFKECDKPDCFRRVRPHIAYCCAECATAAAGRYEIHEHSEGCEQRHAERGEHGKEWHPVSGEEKNA